MVTTKLYAPASARTSEGDWVNAAPEQVNDTYGLLREVSAQGGPSILGEGPQVTHRWRGLIFDGYEPEPGWEVEAGDRRYRVLTAAHMLGKVWRLELERIG
jgi:hypothetical protein